eukprot:jgi/Hompol1/4830/HPOL_001847-RA
MTGNGDDVPGQHGASDNVFVGLMEECGATPADQGNWQLRDNISPFTFSERLRLRLRNNRPLLNRFVDDFSLLMDDPQTFARMLADATAADSQGATAAQPILRHVAPSCTLRLVEKLAEFVPEDMGPIKSNVPRKIIRQLCWLDHIVAPSDMVEKIIEVIQVCCIEVQREIITSIPEIVIDSDHKRISICLMGLMSQNDQLAQVILDTLTSLSMDEDILAAVRDECINKLDTATIDMLPVILRFLLNIATAESATMILRRIRTHLQIDSIAHILALEAREIEQGRSKGKKAERFPQALILASHRKKAQALIKKKAVTGDITAKLIKKMLASHGCSIQSYFTCLLGIADFLMSTALDCCNELCIEFYIRLFQTSDASGRQQVIGALATHIGTGLEFNISVSLLVLLELSRTAPESVTPFSIFIKSILDYLDKLNVSNVRKFFEVLSNLAVLSDNESFDTQTVNQLISFESSILTDLHIVIRKQLGSLDRKYKHVGVLGAAVLIQKLAEKGKMSPHTFQQAQQIFETTVSSCRHSMSCLCIVFDELAFLVSQERLHDRFVKWLRKRVFDSFVDMFILEDDEYKQASERISATRDQHERLVLPLSKWMEVELVQTCELAATSKEKVPLSLLLPAGVVMFERKDSLELNSEFDVPARHAVCTAIFQAINWFREILNCFSAAADEQCAQICLARVGHILELERYLQSILLTLPGWLPPMLLEESASSNTNMNFGTRSSNVVLRGSDSRLFDEDSFASSSSLKEKSRKGPKGHVAKNASARVLPLLLEIKDLRPYMRELEMSVFDLLIHNSTSEEASLTHVELEFLFTDLAAKVEYHFGIKGRQIGRKPQVTRPDLEIISRFAPRIVFEKIVGFMPGVCKILETVGNALREIAMDEDATLGVTDQPLMSVFETIMNILTSLLKWPGAFDYIARFEKCLATAEAAVSLLHVLVALHELVPHNERTLLKLRFFSKSFVNREWKNASSIK